MLILHVHDRWSALGGADWHLVSVLDSMPDGFAVAGLFGRRDGSAPDDLHLPAGIHYIKRLDRTARFDAEERVGERVRELIERLSPDLIHVHNIMNPHLLKVLAMSGPPAVMTVQDHRVFCPGRGKLKRDGSVCRQGMGLDCAGCFEDESYFFRMLTLVRERQVALERFCAYIVLSEYMRAELIQAGLSPDRIHVIPPFVHGLETGYSRAAVGRRVLFAGRMVEAKGFIDLLEAMVMVDKDICLVAAGNGPLLDPARERAVEAGLAGRVEFMGWVSHRELAPLYRRARMVVLPSRWQEPFGITGLEAQAMARPVAAFDVGGVRDWLEDGRTGILAPVGNVEALAGAIDLLWRDEDLATKMGGEGRRLSSARFDREELMTKLTTLYREVGA